MGILSKLFGSSRQEEVVFENPVKVDIHSHLLPGLDDGVDDFEEAIELIRGFAELGYKKLITTPHVMSDFYKNEPDVILAKLEELRNVLKENNMNIEIDAAAEYFMDESLPKLASDKKLLSFGDRKYVLVETAFLNKNDYFQNIMFDLRIQGYTPILAHPERYTYMYREPKHYHEIHEREVLFQVNMGSLAGYYSKDVKRMAEYLIKEGLVDFVGSDAHHLRHIAPMKAAIQTKAYQQMVQLPLRNNSLLKV